jgi:Adenosylmethionine-8-amino-7-oxononanoate aminotransferase
MAQNGVYDIANLKSDTRHLILDLRQMKSFCEKPLIVAEAKGIYLTDIDGKRYIDGISGIYTVNAGHGNEYIMEAVRKQQDKVSFVAPLHAVADIAVKYAVKLASVIPGSLNTIKLLSGGSEATETAVKFIRQYFRQRGVSSRYKIISLYKGFHGATMGAMSASGLAGPRKGVFSPFIEGYVKVQPPTCFRCPYKQSYPSCNCLCAQMLESTIISEGPESVAAFIIEPIGNTGGIVTPPEGYLKAVREICSKYDVKLIFDEIITGMGRTGEWFAAQTFGVEPDLLCAGKGLSSGYSPLAAVAIKDELYFSTFWGEDDENIQFATGHTFGGNPVSSAAGLATIEYIERNNLIENGRMIGEYIRSKLKKEIGKMGILGEIRGKGCLSCVEFVQDQVSNKPFPAERKFGKKVEKRLVEAGLILRCDPDWIAFAPPLITTKGQVDEMMDIFVKCVEKELGCEN